MYIPRSRVRIARYHGRRDAAEDQADTSAFSLVNKSLLHLFLPIYRIEIVENIG